MSILGLVRRRSVARALVNLIPSDYGKMTVDTDSDGVVDGFTHTHSLEVSVLTLDVGMPGQKISLAAVANANAALYLIRAAKETVSPNTSYTLSVDAALVRSGAEVLRLNIAWYTAGDVLISQSFQTNINPGTTYSRQSVTATSPATAAKAEVAFLVFAAAIGATGSAWFKDALFTGG